MTRIFSGKFGSRFKCSRRAGTKKVKTINDRPSVKEVEELWKLCVKERAGWKSEYGPDERPLQAHHIMGKPNYRLRFELDNGICISMGTHKRYHEFEKRAWELDRRKADNMRHDFLVIRGVDERKMEILKNQTGGTDLFLVKAFLLQEFERLKKKNEVPEEF